MTVQNLGAILVRVLAVVIFLYAFNLIVSAISLSISGHFVGIPISPEDTSLVRLVLFLPAVFMLMLTVVLWVFPKSIAGLLIPKNIRNIEWQWVNAEQLETAAIGFLGLFLLCSTLPDLAFDIFALLPIFNDMIDYQDQMLWANLMVSIVRICLGAFLLFRGAFFIRTIRKLRK